MTFSSKRSALVSGLVRDKTRAYIPVPMLVDSGADENFVTAKLVEHLGVPLDKSEVMDYVDGSNTRCKSLGLVTLTIRLHSAITFRANFHVIRTCPFDIVLGPALAIPRGVFDFFTRSLQFKGGITIPSTDPFPSEVADLPLGHPTVAAFASGDYEDTEPDFIAESPLTSVLESPTAEEIEALSKPGGDAPKQFPNINPDLPPEMYNRLKALIQKYFDLGVWNRPCNDDRLRSTLPVFRIHLKPGTVPFWQGHGRPVWSQTEKIEEMVKQLLDAGIIERSNSPWSCNPFIVNGTRLVFNFKGLNAATIPEKFDTANPKDILDWAGAAEWVSIGDLAKAYHQFNIHVDDREYTAFTTSSGHYHFIAVPFGPTNAPAFFNRMMCLAIGALLHTRSFFDDVTTATVAEGNKSGFDMHLIALEQLFEALLAHRLRLEPAKCYYGFKDVNVLGFRVRAGLGVSPQHRRIEPILAMRPPTTKTELRGFLGAAQVYASFIPSYAEIVQPLTEVTKGTKTGALTTWGPIHDERFQKVKDHLSSEPVMRSPDPKRRFLVFTDASTTAVGGVLQQKDDEGHLHPIHYTSKQLTPAQKRYTTQEIEALGLMRCLTAFYHYLLGKEFDVYTDHQALLNIKTTTSPSLRVQRWSMYIQQFDFIIHHKPGRLHVVADWMSRADVPSEPTRFEGLLAFQSMPSSGDEIASRSTWLKSQSQDDYCLTVSRSLQDGSVSDSQFVSDDDKLLYHREFHSGTLQLVVPLVLQDKVLTLCHSLPTAAHSGVRRTSDRVFQSFFWPGWKRSVAQFVQSCELCQQTRPHQQRSSFIKATPRPVVAYQFNELVSMDIQGPFVRTLLGNTYVLNMTCVCTHFTISMALPDTMAATVATMFLNTWVQFFGPPQTILTDNGTNFTSQLLTELWTLFSTRMRFTTPYHPQANPVERFGRTLNAAIAKHVSSNQTDWDQYLGLVNYAYNSSIHDVTGVSPASAVFKIQPTTLLEFLHMLPISADLRTTWAQRGKVIMENALEQCRDTAFSRRQRAVEQIDPINEAEEPFGVGDIVWLADRHGPRDGRKAKHTLKHTGPYRVTRCLPPFAYLISHVHTGASYRAHYYHMTLAPETTQRKYRLSGLGGGGEGKDTLTESNSLLEPADTGLPTSQPSSDIASSTLSVGPVHTSTMSTEGNRFPTDPGRSNITTKLQLQSTTSELLGTTQDEQHLLPKISRKGRVLSIPQRYLNVFMVCQTIAAERRGGEDPEGGRM